MHHVENTSDFFEFIEATQYTSLVTTQEEDREVMDKIHLLAQLAGLNDRQEETLIALYVYGGDTTLISQLRRMMPGLGFQILKTNTITTKRASYSALFFSLFGKTYWARAK